jgi:hypothetical protein
MTTGQAILTGELVKCRKYEYFVRVAGDRPDTKKRNQVWQTREKLLFLWSTLEFSWCKSVLTFVFSALNLVCDVCKVALTRFSKTISFSR